MLKISFDFDIESRAVTNVKVVDVPPKYDNINLPVVEVEDSRLIISPKAIELMSVKYGDRIAVNYIQKNNEITIPVIGKAEAFADPNAGNKVSKNNTVSFKGTQKTILTKYGQLFKIKEYKPGMFRMDPINEADLISADLSLITENNEQSLYEELKEIFMNKDLYTYYKEKIKERSSFFDQEVLAKEIENIL